MSTSLYPKKHKQTARMIITVLVVFFIALIAVATLGGCSAATAKPDPKASQAVAPSTKPVEKKDPNLHKLGDTVTFDDGLSLSVSLPSAYTPTPEAAGVVPGKPAVAFEFIITNNTSEAFDPSLVMISSASSGSEAKGIFDNENGIGFPPVTSVAPGQTIKWQQAWSVDDINDITLDAEVGFTHNKQLFTSK